MVHALGLLFVYQPKSLYNHALSIIVNISVGVAVSSPPGHMDRHRNFVFGVNMYTCPLYIHIKYLVILTFSF